MLEIDDLNDMLLFAKVIEHGSYSAASRALGVATSTLSRRISQLERQLGVQLMNRSTRSLALTQAGEGFLRHCTAIVGEAQAACEGIELTRDAPRGLVRIACPVVMLFGDVGKVLVQYMSDNPEVQVRVEAMNRPVDVIEEGFDLVLRAALPPLEDSDLAIRTLGILETVIVCSPWFVAQHRRPESPDDLADLPTLTIEHTGNRHTWSAVDADGRTIDIPIAPRLVTNDPTTLRQAALVGLGVARLPLALVREDLAAGRLLQVLPDLQQVGRIVHVVFPSRRGLNPAVRALIDALVAGYAGLGAPCSA